MRSVFYSAIGVLLTGTVALSAASDPAPSWEELLKERRQWWSLQPPCKSAPRVKNESWSADPVDHFLLARMEAAGLEPAEPAARNTLIRRLSLVLTGLPPTPAEVAAFVRDDSLDAYEKLVERLLAAPQFGERWARHWLDVIRFSETHGNEWNYEVHHAWRYRDYLIRAFNQDVPYDQFVREHLAGDLLTQPRLNRQEGFNESVIGTAFYRFGEVNHDDCIGIRQIGFDLADNQIDTLGKAFQATTIACARCHDHKLDAVSMKDYYALLGILRSARPVSHTLDLPEVNAQPLRQLRVLKSAVRQEIGAVWLREARAVGPYLLAAQAKLANRSDAHELAKGLDPKRLDAWLRALKTEKSPPDDPLSHWRSMSSTGSADFPAEWKKLAERWTNQERERVEFNRQHFLNYLDSRGGNYAAWQVSGVGLRDGATPSGNFILGDERDTLLTAILPAGYFTHALSSRLNGTLRSVPLPRGTKKISFQVMGKHSSAVRVVSNNCQLNYHNYRALTSDELQWVTFTLPEDGDSLRVYAELMTMFDNPKFPDQLSALGGDKENYRLPWEKAAANPRSFFGVTRVVLHDGPELPKPDLGHLRALFAPTPETAALRSVDELARRYSSAVESAVKNWVADLATDEDAHWLDSMLRRDLLGNSVHLTPRLETLVTQYRETEKELSLPRIVPGMADCGTGRDQQLFTRGDYNRPAEAVPRRYLEVLSKAEERFAPVSSGRLELAERIARPDNPLTARVMVNRIWHHLFGAGLVRSVDDFGHNGDLPSHPELLDYLAVRFVEDGWSVKRLIRTLVQTRAFQMANRPSAASKAVDPQNRLLQHYPARRMEAEAIRDSILSASGRLNSMLYGPSIQPFREQEIADRRLFAGPLDGVGRRSVYIKNNLMESPKFLGAFNFPGGKIAQGRRDVTNVPAQALALLNDDFVLQQADVWAERLLARPDESAGARVEWMFQTALGRAPNTDERNRFEGAVSQFAQLHGVPADNILLSRAVWKDLAHALFNVKEFIYIP